MSFPYKSIPIVDKNGIAIKIIEKTIIPVILIASHKIAKYPVDCLVDSGADINLFPASWGESIGLKIRKGTEVKIWGIGTSFVLAYKHTVKLVLGNSKIQLETDVYFSFDQTIPLLGRDGFFNKFKSITFDEVECQLTITQ